MKEKIKIWGHLFRYWSLTATFVPIWLAACANLPHAAETATRAQFVENFLLSLVSCGCLQIACNLLNVWGDYRSGLDREGVPCSHPELVNGQVTSNEVVLVAAGITVAGLVAAGFLLVRCFSPGLCSLAVTGTLGVVNYSTGLKFKYHGFGLFCVFFLMGYLLLFSADLCLGGTLTSLLTRPGMFWVPVLYGLPVSCLVACIMHANDMRDIEGDASAGIRTPATILGRKGALRLYFMFHLLPYVASGLALLLLPLTTLTLRHAVRGQDGIPAESWKGLLPETARLHLLFGILQGFSFGLFVFLFV